MHRHGVRGLILAATATTALAAFLAGCSEGDSPSGAVSKAASAASEAGDALASATAEAGQKFDDVKNGVDAKGDVKLDGKVTPDADGRATVKLTATNSASATKSYVIQVDFRDKDGNLLGVSVVTVNDVAKGASKDATARTNRSLSGDITAGVARAVRY
ncbi:hypothetical protein BKI49_09680 [Streptomyces sp. Tue6028]|uniref:FxLYD domain-containing protein n=1 Tax=Streptomyces sp. Tue6028 TaxID=2036037 RepID=UPI000BD41CA6|nr:FxLYD domain-containing protein [Streptomyces sp. Tue6028]PBC63970.1 hypothetical protein BKI49_09680 [Streptomyces sp. Tue6028]